jgi:hypothetical protein
MEDRMAQDDIREKAQIKHFGLSEFSETNRGNQYWPDAKIVIDGKEVTIELKTKPEFVMRKGSLKSKRDVSTARGFGPKKAQEWKKKTNIFLFSEYSGHEWNGCFTDHYALTYDALEPWIKQKVLKPYNEGRKKYFGLNEYQQKLMPLIQNGLSSEDIERLKYTLENGNSLNDPKIPWNYIVENGWKVDNTQHIENYWRKIGKGNTNEN